jgi:hypothetical protein
LTNMIKEGRLHAYTGWVSSRKHGRCRWHEHAHGGAGQKPIGPRVSVNEFGI